MNDRCRICGETRMNDKHNVGPEYRWDKRLGTHVSKTGHGFAMRPQDYARKP
jgi:hypothetical protein